MTKGYPLSRASKAWDLISNAWPGLLAALGGAEAAAVSGDPESLARIGGIIDPTVRAAGGMERYMALAREDPRLITPDDATWYRRWAASRHVYRLDADVAAALGGMGLSDRVPVEAIRLMPYPVVYLDMPMRRPERRAGEGPGRAMGCLAWLDRGPAGEELLYLHYIDADLCRVRIGLEMNDGMTVEEMAMRAREVDEVSPCGRGNAGAEAYREFALVVSEALNALLFICSAEAGAETVYAPAARPRGARTGRRTNTETVELVGAEMGRAIGAARSAGGARAAGGTGASVTPHVRRAHWQHYWTGKRAGRADGRHGDALVLHWVAPVLVGGVADAPVERIHRG